MEGNELKIRSKDIEEEKIDIPDWHINLVRRRLKDYENDSESGLDFDSVLHEIENSF